MVVFNPTNILIPLYRNLKKAYKAHIKKHGQKFDFKKIIVLLHTQIKSLKQKAVVRLHLSY